MTSPKALAVGRFRGAVARALEEACSSAQLELHAVESTESALHWAETSDPHSLLVDSTSVDLEQLCLGIRTQARHALVPILSVVQRPTELAFAEIFSSGGDDVVSFRAPAGLISRLRRLPQAPWDRPPASAYRVAVIVASERARRVVLARVVGNAGYAIRFAMDLTEAREAVEDAGPRLVVLDSDSDGLRELVCSLAPKNLNTLWVVSTAPRHVRGVEEWITDVENAAVTDSYAPPENIVFLANELGRGGGGDQRASRRLLHGSLVAFRCAGRDQDDYGLTYNVSRGGMFVRSLAPPVEDRIWLELVPPRTEFRVRLEGRVCWRRPYGPSDAATVPPGFGVEIMDGSQFDRTAWIEGYDKLL